MAFKTKRALIPSICIDEDFLHRLGNIVERDSRRKRQEYEQKIQKISADDQWKIREPHMTVSYKLETADGDISFASSEEILTTNLLPSGIKALAVYITHYGDTGATDISLNISRPSSLLGMALPARYTLSSSNEASLLVVDKELKELFSAFKTGYHSVLYSTNNYVFFMIASLAVAYLAARIMYKSTENLMPGVGGIYLVLLLSWGIYSTSMDALKWAYPFYEFDFSPTESFRKNFRITIWIILLGVISGLILLPLS